MDKISFSKLDFNLYYEKLDNGLEVYLLPNENVQNKYVTFSTKYGSIDNEFIPHGMNTMKKVPDGIAHFLEHKLFEQESGEDPFTFFSERGADANANTSHYKTTYLFSGTDFLEENLNFLLDYVQSPYFTDENVLKEQGIIEQEILMYQDNPYSKLSEELIYNAFCNHPIKYSVIGNAKSIHSITKEDLYLCYNTFYHPSNMFVVVVGNIDVESILNLIKRNQSQKEFPPFKEIVRKTYKEPDHVSKKYSLLQMDNIYLPKVSIGYKINKSKFSMDDVSIKMYLSIVFDILLGNTSLFYETLKHDKLIYDDIYMDMITTNEHILFILSAEVEDTNLFIQKVEEVLKTRTISEEEFERKKKVFISNSILMTDNIYTVGNKIMSDVVSYNKVIPDMMDRIHDISFEKMQEFNKKLDLDNKTVCIIEAKEK